MIKQTKQPTLVRMGHEERSPSVGKFRFYLIGYFGETNFGDELLCWVELERLRTVFGGECMFLTLNAVRSLKYSAPQAKPIEGYFPSVQYFRRIFSHIRAANSSDLVVIGGGGLLGDYYSWTAIPCYTIDALWATIFGRRFVLVGLGVRGVDRLWLRYLCRWLLRNARAIYCRDEKSAHKARDLLQGIEISVGPDLGHLVSIAKPSARKRRYTVLNLRRNPPPPDMNRVVGLSLAMQKRFGHVVLLCAEKVDLPFYQKLLELLPAERQRYFEVCEPGSLRDDMALISSAELVVAERLHVNLVALHAGVPIIALAYEDKVRDLLDGVLPGGAVSFVFPLEAIGPDLIDKPVLNPSTADSVAKKLNQLQEEAAEQFDNAIHAGLAAGRPTWRQRFMAMVWLVVLLPSVGVLMAASKMRRWMRRN